MDEGAADQMDNAPEGEATEPVASEAAPAPEQPEIVAENATEGAEAHTGENGAVEPNGEAAEAQEQPVRRSSILLGTFTPHLDVSIARSQAAENGEEVPMEDGGNLTISLRDIVVAPRRPASKIPGEFTKIPATSAFAKEKKREALHIYPIAGLLQTAGNFVGTAEWRVSGKGRSWLLILRQIGSHVPPSIASV